MLSRIVFNQQWVTMRGDVHYEVTQPTQKCWLLESEDKAPIACMLVLSQTQVKAKQMDQKQGWASVVLDSNENVDIQIVFCNLFFDEYIRLLAMLPNGLSMGEQVKPGGSLACPINFSTVRAFVIRVFPTSSHLADLFSNAKWRFCDEQVICRPRSMTRMMPMSNMPMPFELVGSGGPIPDEVPLGEEDEEKEPVPETQPLQVRIEVNAQTFAEQEEHPGPALIIREGARVMMECILGQEGF